MPRCRTTSYVSCQSNALPCHEDYNDDDDDDDDINNNNDDDDDDDCYDGYGDSENLSDKCWQNDSLTHGTGIHYSQVKLPLKTADQASDNIMEYMDMVETSY